MGAYKDAERKIKEDDKRQADIVKVLIRRFSDVEAIMLVLIDNRITTRKELDELSNSLYETASRALNKTDA